MTEELKVGDAVEVAFTTHDGTIWNPARVSFVDAKSISVEHRDGSQEVMFRGGGRYRIPKATQRPAATHQPSPDKITRG